VFKSLSYCDWALALIAAFSHAQVFEPQKEPLNAGTQSESCLQERS